MPFTMAAPVPSLVLGLLLARGIQASLLLPLRPVAVPCPKLPAPFPSCDLSLLLDEHASRTQELLPHLSCTATPTSAGLSPPLSGGTHQTALIPGAEWPCTVLCVYPSQSESQIHHSLWGGSASCLLDPTGATKPHRARLDRGTLAISLL